MLARVIHARGLARTFRKKKQEVRAVTGVDLDVDAGEIVGFLGPNGAGKTTTLRMLTTLLEPTAGTATVAGCDLITDPVGVRRRIGYVSQSGSTYPDARAGEEVVDHARLYGMTTAQATERGRQLFRELDEADALCDRILLSDPGAIVASGTPDELKSQIGGDVLTVTVERADQIAD